MKLKVFSQMSRFATCEAKPNQVHGHAVKSVPISVANVS